ncbi:hypothetical protein ACKS0A_08822 [Histoplasma ohiense]
MTPVRLAQGDETGEYSCGLMLLVADVVDTNVSLRPCRGPINNVDERSVNSACGGAMLRGVKNSS